MSPIATFLVLSLAAYRLTRLVTTDSIGDRPREWWYLHFPPNMDYQRRTRSVWDDQRGEWRPAGPWRPVMIRKHTSTGGQRVVWGLKQHAQRAKHPLGVLIDCPWCIGFWISVAVVVAADRYTSLPLVAAWPWAISTIVGATDKAVD